MALLKRYFEDMKKEGKSSDVAVLVIGGIIFLFGLLTAALDFILVQRMIYLFDLVSLAGWLLLPLGFAIRIQARRTLDKHFSPVVRILPDHKLIT